MALIIGIVSLVVSIALVFAVLRIFTVADELVKIRRMLDVVTKLYLAQNQPMQAPRSPLPPP